jgi:hypothetical protein
MLGDIRQGNARTRMASAFQMRIFSQWHENTMSEIALCIIAQNPRLWALA